MASTNRRCVVITLGDVEDNDGANWQDNTWRGGYLDRLEGLFTCSWLGLAVKPCIIRFGQYVQIVVETTGAKYAIKTLILAAFPEFAGDHIKVSFTKGDGTLAQHLIDDVPPDQRVLRRKSDDELMAMWRKCKRQGAPPAAPPKALTTTVSTPPVDEGEGGTSSVTISGSEPAVVEPTKTLADEFGSMALGKKQPASVSAIKACNHCKCEGAQHKCSRCKSAFYCGRTCQRAAWREHKVRCGQFCLLRDAAATAADTKTQQAAEAAGVEKMVKTAEAQHAAQQRAEGAPGKDDCTLCLDCIAPADALALACGHVFHRACVASLRKYAASGISQLCPNCRAPLPPGPKQLSSDAGLLLARAEATKGMELRRGRFAEAGALARQALAENSSLVDGHFVLGVALHVGEADADGAEAAYRAAIKCGPKHANAHYNLGLLLEEKGDAGGAEAAVRTAIKCDPKHTNAHYMLGVLLKEKGNADGAEAAYRVAVKCDPKHTGAHYNLGLLLDQKGDAGGAEAE
jgi:tetratricopeptide (TPR) repeat protein